MGTLRKLGQFLGFVRKDKPVSPSIPRAAAIEADVIKEPVGMPRVKKAKAKPPEKPIVARCAKLYRNWHVGKAYYSGTGH